MRRICLNFFRPLLPLFSEKLMEMSKNLLSPHVNESEKKFMDPDLDLDQDLHETLKTQGEDLCSVIFFRQIGPVLSEK